MKRPNCSIEVDQPILSEIDSNKVRKAYDSYTF